MRCGLSILVATVLSAAHAAAAQAPVRIAVSRLTHDQVGRVWSVKNPEVQVVGIYEPNAELVDRLAKRFGFDRKLVYADLAKMLDDVKPEAVVAFGSIYEHLGVVEAAAPRGVHVMVEKPLAVSVEHALRMESLAKRHGIHVLTNYETTWNPSMLATHTLIQGDSAIGPLRKLVVHDGHQGPREIGVSKEFLAWLTDLVQNGGGALIDFGCYGANLATWLMRGEAPLTVTAVTQHIKPDVYPRVDDEATIILTYPQTQAIIQASWNWPSALAPRTPPDQKEWQYLAAVVRGSIRMSDTDLASLANNMTVVRILDAARRAAASGMTVKLGRI